jgi:phospholipase/carboxylesterase
MLHGIGSDGDDLMGLAPLLADEFPTTAFHAPNAPQRFAEAGFGYQWYPRHALAQGDNAQRVERAVNGFIDETLAQHGLPSSRCVLLGFSQGSIVAMHVAPRRKDTLAGVVAFSGDIQTAETLEREKASTPSVVLIHGDQDPVLSPRESENAAHILNAAGIPATLHILRGLGHSIDHRGLRIAIDFMKQVLSAKQPST